jgi:hypothetical protein
MVCPAHWPPAAAFLVIRGGAIAEFFDAHNGEVINPGGLEAMSSPTVFLSLGHRLEDDHPVHAWDLTSTTSRLSYASLAMSEFCVVACAIKTKLMSNGLVVARP